MQQLPSNSTAYKKTPIFNEKTIPPGLQKSHQTKPGTWGRIVVLEGQLRYRILNPTIEEHILDPETFGVVEPEVPHEVAPEGPVRFYVEFHRSENPD